MMYANRRNGILMLIAAVLAAPATPSQGDDWPCFRGPRRSGVSADRGTPLRWSDTENIAWKTPLPGRGASSPIVWRDRIYLTAYTGYGMVNNDPHRNLGKLVRHLLCFSRDTGKLLWKVDRPAGEQPSEHPIVDFLDLHGYATNTPVADESGVYAYFGTSGAVAYDHSGKQKWETVLGDGYYNWGTAASPVLYGDLVIVHADIEAGALIGLDKRTGRQRWRVDTGDRDSWSTPLVVQAQGRAELVYHHAQGEPATLAAVDPRDGTSLWQCKVLKNYLCPSPIEHEGTIYTFGYQRGAAVRAGGRGEVEPIWEMRKGSEVNTPVFYQGHLYWPEVEEGIALCADAKTGELVYQERLEPRPGRIYASGVIADGKLYYVSREGGAYVLDAAPRFKLLAHNKIESDTSIFNATPAVSRGQLLLRSDKFLYCIGKK
jgi:outer membrane protein assembly factor BamB